jgi:hypothetical protein
MALPPTVSEMNRKLDEILHVLNSHTTILNRQSGTLNSHTTLLDKHSETLNRHSALLVQLSRIAGEMQGMLRTLIRRG